MMDYEHESKGIVYAIETLKFHENTFYTSDGFAYNYIGVNLITHTSNQTELKGIHT